MADLQQSTERLYLRDLGTLLKERAFEAETRLPKIGSTERDFALGRLMAFHEVISLMQQQAVAFDLAIGELNLGDELRLLPL